MTYSKVFCIVFTLIFIVFSCQDKPVNDETKPIGTLDSKYKNLPDFEWLKEQKNYQDESYQSKFKNRFEENLKNNNFEDAAAYLIAYGTALSRLAFFDSAYTATTTNFFEEYNHKISGEAKSHLCHYLGTQYHSQSKLDKSFYWHKKCLEYEPETDTHKQIQGFTHFSLAQNYLRQRELDSTELHLVSALKIFEEVGDLKNQGTVYLLMHNLYVQNRAYEDAEKTINKAIEIIKKEKSDYLTFSAQSMYVHFHIEQGDTLKTINQIDSLAKYAKEYKDIPDYHEGILNQFLAFKFIAQKKEDSATYYLNIAKEITDRKAIPDLKMRTFFQEILFCNTFKKPLENPEEVEEFYQEMANAEEPNRQFMYQMATALYRFHQDAGNYKKANEYSLFIIDDVNKQSKDRLKNQLFEMNVKFETERKEKTILLQDKKLEQKNKTIVTLITASVFGLLILFLMFGWSKYKNISKEKEMARHFASQLVQKTEEERKRIASDLHDSVSNELVNLRHVIEGNNNQLKDRIDVILNEVRNISRNISPTLFDKVGFKASVEQLTERIQNQHRFFINSEIDYSGSLGTDKELQLYRIIQEAITNTLKHAEAVAAKITISEKPQSVNIEIKDNGKGFNVDKMLEKGDCFGLLNITERTKHMNGTVDFQSNSNGTTIKISIPK